MEITPDVAATVIMEAWPKVENVTVFDVWEDSDGIANVRAQWDIDGMTLKQNIRMAAERDQIKIL